MADAQRAEGDDDETRLANQGSHRLRDPGSRHERCADCARLRPRWHGGRIFAHRDADGIRCCGIAASRACILGHVVPQRATLAELTAEKTRKDGSLFDNMTRGPPAAPSIALDKMTRTLRCAKTLVQLGDIAFAARRLRLSQAALRAELRSIEQAFGVTLFNGPEPGAGIVVEAVAQFERRACNASGGSGV
jgi:Bacterial regulatory helix-turn-helix protein, lysR family